MDIVCARTGRHFSSVEAARACSNEHNRCNACLFDKKYREPAVRFTSRGTDAATLRDIDSLMTDINSYLKGAKLKIPYTRRASHFGRGERIMINRFARSIIKLCLNFTILVGLVLLVRYGYRLFTAPQESPLRASIYLILGFVAWLAVIRLSRSRSRHYWLRYKGVWPGFKLVTFLVIVILLVFAFAGVQPFTGYKDSVVDLVSDRLEQFKVEQEVVRVAEEERQAVEEAEMSAVGVVDEYCFYKEYVVLFNEFRAANGSPPLVFDPRLNELAARRASEISQPGNFSHTGIMQYNFGENIAMMAYSSGSADRLVEQWSTSPGHRANMLSLQYCRTGFGKDGKYAVQIFD